MLLFFEFVFKYSEYSISNKNAFKCVVCIVYTYVYVVIRSGVYDIKRLNAISILH